VLPGCVVRSAVDRNDTLNRVSGFIGVARIAYYRASVSDGEYYETLHGSYDMNAFIAINPGEV
jgi:hypothetical protein